MLSCGRCGKELGNMALRGLLVYIIYIVGLDFWQ